MHIACSRTKEILRRLPQGVTLVAAAKGRSPEEIRAAVDGGVEVVGENYVQQAQEAYKVLGDRVRWHVIGHLQRNKVKHAVKIFDMIETVDSIRLAEQIEKCSALLDKRMPVLVEINSGREMQKSGILPEDAEGLVRHLAGLEHVRVGEMYTKRRPGRMGEPSD
jgi:uncharacterized pyridoxal phosphate-containing UPF0001 family protein